MRKFSVEEIAATNEALRSKRPVNVRDIDFKNPYFTQPQSAAKADVDLLLASLTGKTADHIYVHVPFCAVHCLYCHYPKLTNEHSEDNQAAFLRHLEEEIAFFGNRMDVTRPRTVHIGGGTPNCLSTPNLERLLELLGRHFRPTQEYAIELYPSPADLPREKLELLARFGIDRVSIGVQTFEDSINVRNRRLGQSRESALTAVSDSLALFPNVSIDLLYGQREQQLSHLLEDCRIAADLRVNSVYLYQTREWLNRSSVDLQSALNEFLAFFESAGYDIVSFDQAIRRRNSDGFCRHRSGRSQSEDLLGFGPGAVSEIGDFIYRNVAPRPYLEQGHGVEAAAIVQRSQRTVRAEFINRGLRHFNVPGVDGLLNEAYRERFGSTPIDDFPEEVALLKSQGVIEHDDDSVRITPYGMLFSQAINYLLLGHYK